MQYDRLQTLLTASISRALGERTHVGVRREGFKPLKRKASVATLLGATGMVFEVRLDGWGPAFERRTITSQVVVDAAAPDDHSVASALHQLQATLLLQNLRAGRAVSLGIDRPLDIDEFADTGRLQLDVASAYALRSLHGSDTAVRDWLRRQLRAFHEDPRRGGEERAIDVRGTELRIPFNLAPLRPLRSASDRALPTWEGAEVRLPASEAENVDEALRAAKTLLADTPAARRAVTACEHHPTKTLLAAWRYGSARNASREDVSGIALRMYWKLFLEPKTVSVSEAFG